jgi:hypothetical protein
MCITDLLVKPLKSRQRPLIRVKHSQKGKHKNINYLVHKLTLWPKCRRIVKRGADGRPDRILKRRPKPIFDVDSTDIEMKIKLSMTATSPGKEGESGAG